jgi:hypothetical protein
MWYAKSLSALQHPQWDRKWDSCEKVVAIGYYGLVHYSSGIGYEYSTPYDSPDRKKVQEILCEDDENKDLVISEIAGRAIKEEAEFVFIGEEFTFTEDSNQ